MNEIALFDAKNRLSELIVRVEAGEEFIITRRGKAVARLARLDGGATQKRAQKAIANLEASRKGVSLGRLRSRDLISAGRR